VLNTNLYSFTQPNHPFLNHHWLVGVIFYVIYTVAGFAGLTLFSSFINGFTCFLIYLFLKKKTNAIVAFLLSLFYLVFITTRIEVRPEIFTNLFFVTLIVALDSYKQFSPKYLALLFMQVIWVNIHIFFFFSFLVTGSFILYYIYKKEIILAKHFVVFLLLQMSVSCINPHGIYGLLEPLLIFRGYGFQPVENLPLTYVYEKFGLHPVLIIYAFISLLTLFIKAMVIVKKRFIPVPFIMLFLTFLVGSFLMLRLLALFGIATVLLLAVLLEDLVKHGNISMLDKFYLDNKAGIRKIVFIYCFFVGFVALLSINKATFGVGLKNGVQDSAKFYIDHHMHGNIFNDYDIGGYLIYNLYPQQRVFVDNRPEAYSEQFFKNEYLPLGTDNALWDKMSDTYQINVLYIHHKNILTKFISNRLRDPNWRLVYADDYALIFVKNIADNSYIIDNSTVDKNTLDKLYEDYSE
jgi:hypothetical protein